MTTYHFTWPVLPAGARFYDMDGNPLELATADELNALTMQAYAEREPYIVVDPSDDHWRSANG